MSDKIIVKKRIQPYPIEVTIDNSGQISVGQIKKLTEVGFLVDVGDQFFEVSQHLHVQFEIPVFNKQVLSDVQVIKTYDQFQGSNEAKTHLVEMHFITLPDSFKEAIRKFLITIKQVV